jgi:hypothetical protein
MGFRHALDADTEYAGLYEIAGAVIRETEPGDAKAGAILFTDGTRSEWLPKSRIRLLRDDTVPAEGAAVVFLPEWLAKKKGFI